MLYRASNTQETDCLQSASTSDRPAGVSAARTTKTSNYYMYTVSAAWHWQSVVVPCIDISSALVTGQLAQEISNVSAEMERLYGVLDEDLLKLQ